MVTVRVPMRPGCAAHPVAWSNPVANDCVAFLEQQIRRGDRQLRVADKEPDAQALKNPGLKPLDLQHLLTSTRPP